MGVDQKIKYYADLYQVNYDHMYKTIMCESLASTTIQSMHKDPKGPNGREDSWGIAQINLPWNPEVSREEALDVDFSLNFMAKKFALGYAKRWTCYRNLKLNVNE